MQLYHCEDPKLNLTDARLAAFMKALVLTQGQLASAVTFGEGKWDNWCCAINLPEGTKEKFEEIAGVELTEPEIIRGM